MLKNFLLHNVYTRSLIPCIQHGTNHIWNNWIQKILCPAPFYVHSNTTELAAYLYSRISQVTKFVLGERKWKPVVKKFCARPQWFLELHTHSYRSICRRIYRIKFAFFKFPWNLFPAWAEAAKYTKRICNNRRMLCEVGEPLFVIRRLTLRPLIEDISDKSQTLEGVTLEQKTPHLICIWILQGSLVDLSIYIFEFFGCSEKKMIGRGNMCSIF